VVKAIIFDFDGVIGKSETSRFAILKKAFIKRNLMLPDSEFNHMIGVTTKVFLNNFDIKGLTNDLKEEIREDYNKEYKGNIIKHVQPIIPVVNFIKNYTGSLKLVVASGSDEKILQTLLKYFQIYDKFDKIIGKEQVSNFKPHPETYFIAAKALQISSEESIIIEDSIIGVQAGLAAGATCYVFLNGINKEEEFSNFKIAGFLKETNDFNKILPALKSKA
jgi:beta-phosphoglucomutase